MTPAEQYVADVIAQHEAAVEAAKTKVEKAEAHLTGAREAVRVAEAVLAEVHANPPTYVAPTAHRTARVQ